MLSNKKIQDQKGFTLVEVVIATALLVLVSMGLYRGYTTVMTSIRTSRARATATLLANEQLEIIRNLAYSDVGLIGGIPAGKIPPSQNLVRDGLSFTVTTSIRNIDDPFDGVMGSSTNNDLAPADYKLVAFDINCSNCSNFIPVQFSTTAAPAGLETSTGNGALIVNVFDANGQSVKDASVTVQNASLTPTILINDFTNNNGQLQIVDAPTSTNGYRITVTKSGYSTERTYQIGGAGNPNPIKPHQSVLTKQITQVSFAIDQLSTLNLSTLNANSCAVVPGSSLTLTGSKTIGTNPTVYKNILQWTSDSNGQISIPNTEWDTYSLVSTDNTKNVAGTIPLFPVAINPNSTTNTKVLLATKNGAGILITVRDSASLLPISGATVQITKSGSSTVLTTGQGYQVQTDWSGGSGQTNFADPTKYFSSDGNIDTMSPAGTLKLKTLFGNYLQDGSLISSTFDVSTSSNFYVLSWLPLSQPANAGSSSVKFQLAANNDNATWNFVGPDGTSLSYYTTSAQTIASALAGNRYFRYKLFLHTEDVTVSPTLSDINFTYSTACTPPGQVYFDGLSSGTYAVTVTEPGYQNGAASITVSANGYASSTINLLSS